MLEPRDAVLVLRPARRPVLQEFKEFAIKGSVVDMALGVIVGAAFSSLIKSLVDDVLMPPLGALTGGLDFKNLFMVIRSGAQAGPHATLEEARSAGAVVVAYGNFVNACVAFLLVSGVLFLVVRWMNRLRRPDTPAAPRTKACPFCLSSIDVDVRRCAHCTSELEHSNPLT